MKKLILLFLILSASAYASLLYKIDDGIDLYNLKKYPEAIEYFKKYVNSNPNDKDGYYYLALSYNKQSDDKNALVNYKKSYSLALNEKNLDKIEFEDNEFDNLEDYFDMAASYYEQGLYKEALTYADMMLKIDPDCASAYFIKAKIAYIQDNKVKSLDLLNKAILLDNSLLKTKLAKNLNVYKIPELTKNDYWLYAQKAYYKGELDLSIQYLIKYLELDNNNIDAYLFLIDCYLKNSNPTGASYILSQAQKQIDNNISLMLSNSDIAYFEHNEKYADILLDIYKINPNNKSALLKLGNYYLENQNPKEAKKYFETLINVDDNLYEGYFGYIYSLIQTGEVKEAQNLIRKLSSMNQNEGELNYLLSLICEMNEEYKDALSYIENAIKKDNNFNYYIEAGKLNYILGNYESAIKYLLPVKNNENALEYLVLSYLKINNIDEVRKLISQNTSLDKTRIIYKYYLYKIYKYEDKVELNSILKQKPAKINDYIDIIRINIFENKMNNAQKTYDSAVKKFNQNYQFNIVKNELK